MDCSDLDFLGMTDFRSRLVLTAHNFNVAVCQIALLARNAFQRWIAILSVMNAADAHAFGVMQAGIQARRATNMRQERMMRTQEMSRSRQR